MGCTTILVGKEASNDGSTIMARTEDSGSGSFSIKKFEVVEPQPEPYTYRSVVSHVEIDLPGGGLRYTRFPDVAGDKGLWAGAGINSARVSMTATETLTSNERVLAADPLVELVPAQGVEGEEGYVPEQPGGIGEEDMVVLVLPYIKSAREGVLRLGKLLEKYGTYEMNGIGFADVDEVWWLETIGGHHWIARRLPDDAYAVIANQFSIGYFDLKDAFGKGMNFLCSKDLREFIDDNYLDLQAEVDEDFIDEMPFDPDQMARLEAAGIDLETVKDHMSGSLHARLAFGSRADSDHVYNTPRVWALQQYLTPNIDEVMSGAGEFTPDSDDLAWCLPTPRYITMEDVKYALSYHYQGTAFDPYAREKQARSLSGADRRGMFRPIGINRTNFTAALQLRPDVPAPAMGLNWIAFGAMPFNAMVPFYANVRSVPEYLGGTTARVTTESHYWQNRILAVMADAHFHEVNPHIQRYQQSVVSKARAIVAETDKAVAKLLATQKNKRAAAKNMENPQVQEMLEAANAKIAALLQRETDELLGKVLYEASMHMRNAFALDDA